MIRGLLLAAAVTSSAAPAPPVVPLSGAFVRASAALDAAAWTRLPQVTVKAADHNGQVYDYEGVRLADLLKDSGVPVGDAVRGEAARAYLVVSASDGYTAVFTLAELDTSETRCAPLLADARDGLRLAADVGPVRVIPPCDRTHARWVRGVTKLTIVVTSGA